MFLMVGLGNPGVKYEMTRHNAGFMAIDQLATASWKLERNVLVQKTKIVSKEVILAKPQTYMNLSGAAVQSLLHWYKIPVENLIVFVDDIHLDCGRVRIRKEGSHGGQNGLRDISQKIGTQFTRVRLGVGKKPELWDLSNWVLSRFTKEDFQNFEKILFEIRSITEIILTEGVLAAMDAYNGFK
ncbi:MAG: aminoacyl-tRNA hydrolase [Fibrobacter sp.]|nr:aminoacyl-tRNA hydrolase [Fibrobacter sp.]